VKKSSIIKYIVTFAIGMLLMYFLTKGEDEIVEVPVKIDVPIPVVEVQHDTVFMPAETIQLPGEVKIDTEYYEKWKTLKDSVSRDSLYKDAITIREYNTKFEDDTLTIDVLIE